jgi:hypothetical protein
MSRYLFICGGAGKALVHQSVNLGFDGVIQIDVPQEIVSADTRTESAQVMTIPVMPQDVMTSQEAAMHAAKQELSARCNELHHYADRLVQEPTVAEYVALRDVCGSVYTQYKRQVQATLNMTLRDDYEHHIKDIREFCDTQPRLVQLEENNTEVQEWLRLHEEIAVLQARLKTYQIGVAGTYGTGLLHKSAQPLIWSAYFGRSHVKDAFDEHVRVMLRGRYPSVNDGIEIWIVSSMCGSVGQGITYHVAEYANKFFNACGYTQIMIQLVRIGAVTYQRYSPDHATTCAMALLHDTALAYGVRPQVDRRRLLGLPIDVYQQQQRTQYNFYYLELPEYQDTIVETRRAHDLVVAFRSITNDIFQKRFNVAFVNARPGWHRAINVRFGMWQNTSPHGLTAISLLYPQTAEQVLSEINKLLYPNRVSLDATYRHTIQPNESLQRWRVAPGLDKQMSVTEFRKRWPRMKSFSLPQHAQLYQKSRSTEQDITDFVQSKECEATLTEMQQVISTYIGEHVLHEYGAAFFLTQSEMDESIPLLVAFSAPNESRPEYIDELRLAQSALVKIDRILSSSDDASDGSFAQLYARWKVILPLIFESNHQYELKLRSGIKPLVESLITVRTLLNLRHSAEQRIHHAHRWLETLRQRLQQDLAVFGNQQHKVLVTICDLAKPYRNLPHTWLYAMANAQTSRPASARAEMEYQTTVIWGAQQLTRDGLGHVLKLSSQVSLSHSHSTIQDIVDEISAHCGRNPEGIWWQRQILADAKRNSMTDFAYVILPKLDPDLYRQIIMTPASPGLVKPEIIMVDIEEIGLVACGLQAYRGVDEWFPQQDTRVAHSHIYSTLMPLLARRLGESIEENQRRVALASTGLPVYMTDHIRTLTGNALADVLYEVGA